MGPRFFYIDEPATGGATAPAGYTLTTPQQRSDWNGLVDYMKQQGVAGTPALDKPGAGLRYMQQYQQANPDFSVTPEQIPHIQHEQFQLRNGNTFGNLGEKELSYLRSGLPSVYMGRQVPPADGQLNGATSMLYYPTSGEHGTDIEKYYGAKIGTVPTTEGAPSPAAAFPSVSPATDVAAKGAPGPAKEGPSGAIPLPDFTNAKSRGQYAVNFRKKYGDVFQGNGDIPLNVNEVPLAAKDTSKNISEKYGKQYGIDPALLYTSFMIEGGSGLYKSRATGLDTRGRKPDDYKYQDFSGNKDYPIDAGHSFGLNTIVERMPDLIKGGYLPKGFDKNYQHASMGDGTSIGIPYFKNMESAMQAKAALLKYTQDEVQQYAKQHNVTLSPKALEFFTLAGYNGGEGGYMQRMLDYKKAGLLENDKFLDKRPAREEKYNNPLQEHNDVWGHLIPRFKIRDALKQEKLFD